MRLALLLAAALAAAASGQTVVADTTDPARYVPLDVGNEWVYATNVGTIREAVVADTLVGGEEYAVVLMTGVGDLYGEPDSVRTLVRFDLNTATLIRRDAQGEMTASCPLDADFGTVAICGEVEAGVRGGYDQDIDMYPHVQTEVVATTKTFDRGDHDEVTYASGIGITFASGEDFGGFRYLVYATVDGERIGPPVRPDPANPESYYPLGVGSEWEMFEFLLGAGQWRKRRVIERDTVIAGVRYVLEATYRVRNQERGWGDRKSRWVRFDAGASAVVQLRSDGSEWFATCPLGSSFGDVVFCPWTLSTWDNLDFGASPFLVTGDFLDAVPVGDDQVTIPYQKAFEWIGFSVADTGSHGGYGAGFGPLPWLAPSGCSQCYEEYTYARIVDPDGSVREYGRRYGVSSEDAPATESLTLAAFPTPTAGPLAVEITGVRGPTTVEVFDALGRQVWHAEPIRQRAEVDAGATVEVFDALGRRVWHADAVRQRVEIDASGWAPGLYVVRVRAGVEIATQTITVTR